MNLRNSPNSSSRRRRPGRPSTEMSNITLTQEQFETLLERLNVGSRDPHTTLPVVSESLQNGSFVKCTSRFSGLKSSDVSTFLNAVEVYRDCANISPENALKGLPILLTDDAATWWLGVKSGIKTWDDATAALSNAFGKKRVPYQVYKELFNMEQDETTPSDLFISRARALLSEIPDVLEEKVQMDMIYGLLHRRVRKRVPRDSVITFNELIKQTRAVEQTLSESDKYNKKPNELPPKDKAKKRCIYCRNPGHTIDECQTRLKRKVKASQEQEKSEVSRSKYTGIEKPTVCCYGCGNPGYIRSNCPKCKSSVQLETVEFNTINVDSKLNCRRPLLPVTAFGFHGVATADTGASKSVMGRKLFTLLKEICKFTSHKIAITLADGVTQTYKVLCADVTLKIKNRTLVTNMMVMPHEVENQTLLGADVLTKLGIILDIGAGTWYFRDTPKEIHVFTEVSIPEKPNQIALQEIHSNLHLRPDEGQTFDPEERNQMNEFLEANLLTFATGGEPTPFAEHCILTEPNQPPIAVPPYRLSLPRKEQLRVEVDKMLKEAIIEECDSPWAAPTVLVPKSDNSIRVCIDYRRLNAVTISDTYPMPRIDDLLLEAKRTRYMSTIDLKSGYWQINVRECDRNKTAFITPFGIYRFRRMPFGLKNAPATFQRMMDRFCAGLKGVQVLAYLDDLIILSDNFEQHLHDLHCVFKRLKEFKLRANRAKCQFGKTEIRYLGHILTSEGTKTDPEKIAALKERAPPRNLKELLSVIQSCSWYRRFIPNFAEVARPLTILTKKKTPWIWGPEQQTAYKKLMDLLTSTPILRQVVFSKPFILRTDASEYALGAVLLQCHEDVEHPIEYASRLLTSAERNYTTTEREALAIVWSLQKFRGYVECSEIIVSTDHQPLKWLMPLRTPSGRLARWALQLQSFNLQITYTPGKSNILADALSRPPEPEKRVIAQEEVKLIVADWPRQTTKEIRENQLKDVDLKQIMDAFESDPPNDDYIHWTERGYIMCNGVLYHYDHDEEGEEAQLVIPRDSRQEVLNEYHDNPTAGHNGVERTIHRIRRRFYWPGLRRYVTEYIGKCIECQRYKPSNMKPSGLLQTPPYAKRMEVVSIDFFGPLPKTNRGNTWILVVEDVATRWIELFPMATATASETAAILVEEVFLRYGFPRRLLSDNGSQFVGAVMQQLTYVLGIEQAFTAIYHPESNPTERKNRELKLQLAIILKQDHEEWDLKLPATRFALNTAVCQNTGHTAAYLVFARELRTAFEVHNDLSAVLDAENFVPQLTPYLRKLSETLRIVKETFEKEQERQKKYANQHRRPAPLYNPGDKILLKVHALSNVSQRKTRKFYPKRDGPYHILRPVGPVTYEIADPENPTKPLCKVHTSELTPYIEPNVSEPVVSAQATAPITKKRLRGRPRKHTLPVAGSAARTLSRNQRGSVTLAALDSSTLSNGTI